MTVQDVHDEIYIQLLNRVPSPNQVSAIVCKAATSARRELVRKAEGCPWFYRRSTSMAEVRTSSYVPPYGVTKIMWAAYGKQGLDFCDDRDRVVILKDGVGTPRYFLKEIQGHITLLTILPAPSHADYIRVWYWADQPKFIALEDIVDIPTEYETAFRYLCLSKMWQGLDEKSSGAKSAGDYQRFITEMRLANQKMMIKGRQLFKTLDPVYRF